MGESQGRAAARIAPKGSRGPGPSRRTGSPRGEVGAVGCRGVARRRIPRAARSLLDSEVPALRWKVRVRVLGESRRSSTIRALEQQVRSSLQVRALLAPSAYRSVPGTSRAVYHYWQGAHWILAALADLGYPPGDPMLLPLRQRTLDLWLRPLYSQSFQATSRASAYRKVGVPIVRGRARRCASQQGNALLSSLELGLLDERNDELVRLLERWQWPDGGWNCDKDPDADTSSFHETYHPMLGLHRYGEITGDRDARRAAERAREVFLSRSLFRRRSDGNVMQSRFLTFHYPRYWHYDLLGGLVAMARMGSLSDPRCREALDWLEEQELPTGGWPLQDRYYRYSPTMIPYGDSFEWGRPSARSANPWVTADALWVLSAAGRLAT
jgi:hypothetical protein